MRSDDWEARIYLDRAARRAGGGRYLAGVGRAPLLGSVDKAKEVVLRENLSTMRATLDKFYADTGKYPDSLEELVSMRYLRVIPIDPLLDSNSAWVVIAPPEKTRGAVYDVKSAATGTARDGSAYRDW